VYGFEVDPSFTTAYKGELQAVIGTVTSKLDQVHIVDHNIPLPIAVDEKRVGSSSYTLIGVDAGSDASHIFSTNTSIVILNQHSCTSAVRIVSCASAAKI